MDKHDKYEVVKQAWFEINEHLRNNKQDYIEYLKFSSKMYKQPYSDAVLVFQQDRNATKIAEYKKWGRLGRYVRRGSHGVAVFGKNHTCRYLYDVTQTGGKELPEMWTLTDRNTTELLNTLNNRYNINAGSVKECIEAMTANSINSAPIAESVQNAISQMGLDTKQAEVYRHSLDSVVQFVVSQRCNLSGKINLHADVDVSALDLIKNARDMILFSRAVQHAAKDTLFEIEKEVIAIDRKNEALDNAKTAKQESTSDRVDDILQDLIKLKFSQEQILALKQAVVAAAQNGEHNIQHWVSIRYSPDELQHISSLVADYYAQSVIEQTLDSKGILNDYYTYVNELNGRLKLSDMFSHHDYSDEQKAMLQQGFSEGISITVLNEVDERLTVDEIKTFFEMFHQAVDGQIDPHDVQIYLDKAVIEHSKQNVQAVEVQDNSVDTNSVGVVKQYDNDFYINHSEQKSQELSSYQRLHLPEAMNNLDSKEPIRHAAFTDKQLALSVLNDSNDSVSQNDNEVKTSAALSEPTITCEWSESNYFEDGKTYSVAEFDTLMEQADSEMVAGAKAAIEKYGSAKAWYEADADDEFSQFMGYDKVKFTINMPDGQTITERQDAGDGYGGVIDFLKRYSIYSSIIPELEAAKAAHMADLVNEVPTPTNETQPEIDKLLGRLKLDCDYYLKTGAEKHLWAETVEKQIAKINELYEKMPENAYFTREQIDDYEKKMLAIKNGEVEKPIPYETPTIANNVLSEEKKTTPPVSESTPISPTSDEQISLFETPPASETVTIPDKDVKTEKVENPKKNVKASTYHFDPDNVVVGGAAARCDANIAAIETLLKIEQQALNKEFEMTIGGVRYDKRENAGEQIAVAMAKCTATGEPIELGTYRGFKVTIERNPSANTFFELDTPCIAVLHGELTYSCDIATDNGVGNVRRIENLAGIQINQKLCSLEEQLEKANKDLSEAQQNMLKPFEHGQELAEKTKRLEYVNAQLSGNSQNKNHTPESAIEFRFHNNKYQALIGTNEKSEWCDVVSKGGKLIASSDTKIYNLSEKESDQFRSYVFNGGKTDTSKNNSLLEKLKPKALKL